MYRTAFDIAGNVTQRRLAPLPAKPVHCWRYEQLRPCCCPLLEVPGPRIVLEAVLGDQLLPIFGESSGRCRALRIASFRCNFLRILAR